MNMHWIDWSIVGLLSVVICGGAYTTKKYTLSVADFLSASRCGGRYLLGVAEGIAALGAIDIVARSEMYNRAGFTALWWEAIMLPVTTIIAISGWVIYRFRQTRALTLSQFFEIRYSRKFRIYAGFVAFFCGVLNFGIFPSVGARFFIYFCGFPDTMAVYALVMIVMLSLALLFTFVGGQIAVMVTDFLQGMFCNIMFVVIVIFLFVKFDWSEIAAALSTAPADASMVNPFRTGATKNFNAWYFLIGSVSMFYGTMSWQGQQAYYSSAKSAHEARMGKIVGQLRVLTQSLGILLLALCTFTFLRHEHFAEGARAVYASLGQISSSQLQSQSALSMTLPYILPRGLMGGVCAVVLAAFISTHDTYLHSWGSIFIQDVVMPLRQKPLSPRRHMLWLRVSILGVAVFIFLFSLFFHLKQDIYMFFILTGIIFTGGSGSAIIGGLYWKRGTTAAAWTAMIIGSSFAGAGWYLIYYWHNFQSVAQRFFPDLWNAALNHWPVLASPDSPLNAQWLFFCTMISCVSAYILVSLLGKRTIFDMDRMLHRGKYARQTDSTVAETPNDAVASPPARGWKVLQMGKDFSRSDKIIYAVAYGYILLFFGTFLVGTIYNLFVNKEVTNASWLSFWHGYLWFMLIVSITITIWFSLGGIIDLKKLYAALRVVKRDDRDDGRVIDHHNLDEHA